MLEWFASLINSLAVFGASEASVIFAYQPTTPKRLIDNE